MSRKGKAEEIAVIETGGKQYTVGVGDIVTIERIDSEPKAGRDITFSNVLMVDNGEDTTIGSPYIKGASVTGRLLGERKGKKISIIRYKSKSNRNRKVGERPKHWQIEILSIK